MNRRDSIKAVALGAGLVARPVVAMAEPAGARVFDSRFAASRAFGAVAQPAFDCQSDAAHIWLTSLTEGAFPRGGVEGLTTQADAMILADLARREERRFTLFGPFGSTGLVHWQIA